MEASAARRSQRQWQRDETIAAIERAALPVFIEHGYEYATAERLAEAAGVSVRTLFRYFPSGREDVLLAELRRSIDLHERAIRARPADEPLAVALERALDDYLTQFPSGLLRETIGLTMQIAAEQPALMARLLGERQMLAERLVGFVAERFGLDAERDLRPRLFAHCYVSALVSGYLASRTRPDTPARQLIGEAVGLVLPLLDSMR